MNLFNYLLLFLKGFLMGVADVIPGVSGGTIAFITGIYQKLISNVNLINIEFVKLFFTRPLEAIKKVDFLFLGIVFVGILTSVKTLAGVVTYALEKYPMPTWSLFNGLIISSAIIILVKEVLKKENKDKKMTLAFCFCIVGIFFGYGISSLSPFENSSNSFMVIFFSGFIAISAMILPGISGSFLLVILGKYTVIMKAISNLQIEIIFPFALGCLIGILLIGKIIFFLLKRYYLLTLFFLIGLMLGSLKKIFPWKVAEKNVLPWTFENVNGIGSSQLFFVAIFFLLGILISFLLFRLEGIKKSKS